MDGLFSNIGLWLAELGAWAYLVAPLVMATISICPIPAEAPAMANGVLFGPVLGVIIYLTPDHPVASVVGMRKTRGALYCIAQVVIGCSRVIHRRYDCCPCTLARLLS